MAKSQGKLNKKNRLKWLKKISQQSAHILLACGVFLEMTNVDKLETKKSTEEGNPQRKLLTAAASANCKLQTATSDGTDKDDDTI